MPAAREVGAARGAGERAYFALCLAVGRLLRSARYSSTQIVGPAEGRQVRKRRGVHAPLFIALGSPLFRVLDAGVQILRQHEWVARERSVHRILRGASVGLDARRTLVLPFLPGRTLASLLDDEGLAVTDRLRAIELAVVALADFHRAGLTHGDAMADNVMVDLETGAAHWFDFETLHAPGRTFAWCRADDVRALLTTCLVRARPEDLATTLGLVLESYDDPGVADLLSGYFAHVVQRPLTFHLGQAPLSFRTFNEVGRLLMAFRASAPLAAFAGRADAGRG